MFQCPFCGMSHTTRRDAVDCDCRDKTDNEFHDEEMR